jgi:hypothetical protein
MFSLLSFSCSHVGDFPGTPSVENIRILRQTPSPEAHAWQLSIQYSRLPAIESEHPMSNGDVVLWHLKGEDASFECRGKECDQNGIMQDGKE